MQDQTIDMLLQSQKGKSTGTVTLHAVPREQALRKGLIAFGACWGVALLTIPIPIVHFIAPPLLLLAGPPIGFVIYKIYNGAVDITRGQAPCPDCGTEIRLGQRAERWPIDLVCESCEARLSATKAEGAPS